MTFAPLGGFCDGKLVVSPDGRAKAVHAPHRRMPVF
jgi:hypothetical protein